MTWHLHHLLGCTPSALAHYLKAIGILRVLARQKDPEAMGYWRDERFCLVTQLDRDEIERFFLAEYAPTPFVSPWARGSGFYKQNDPALSPLATSTAPRFAAFRAGIEAGRRPLAAISAADAAIRSLKDRTKKKKGMSAAEVARARALKSDPQFKAELAAKERTFKRLKSELFAPLALEWRGPHREWMDAAMVLEDDNRPIWPSLLGTGGNDGRLDFTNNAMQRLGDLFDLESPSGEAKPAAAAWLRACLWGSAADATVKGAVGQFLPGGAGGANGTTGPEAEARINPWDLVLALEGAVAFRSTATRRLGARTNRAAVPFAVDAHGVGHGTRGREDDKRGEQWMPLWSAPTTLSDLMALLGEGRAHVGRRTAERPLDFARAVSKLGVARGLTGFVRFGYLERMGDSNLAVPLGRVAVGAVPKSRLVDDLAPWLERLHRLVRKEPSARLAAAEAALSDAVFAALTKDDAAARWQAVLIAVSRLEAIQVAGTGFDVGPAPPLSPAWLDAATDDSPEWRLAMALGSAAAEYARDGKVNDRVRHHALPLAKGMRAYEVREKRIQTNPRVVMTSRDPESDLIALVERRAIEGVQRGERSLPLVAQKGAGARASDLAELLLGRVDLERTVALARALMAVRWQHVRLPSTSVSLDGVSSIDEAWLAIRLCGLPFDVRDRRVPLDLGMLRRLVSGDASGAVEIALRRLTAAGFRPPFAGVTADAATARRWAAALAFPIDPNLASAMARRFVTQTKEVP